MTTAFAFDPAAGRVQQYVIDPTFSDRPLRVHEWVEKFVRQPNWFVTLSLWEPNRIEADRAPEPDSFGRALMFSWSRLEQLRKLPPGGDDGA